MKPQNTRLEATMKAGEIYQGEKNRNRSDSDTKNNNTMNNKEEEASLFGPTRSMDSSMDLRQLELSMDLEEAGGFLSQKCLR